MPGLAGLILVYCCANINLLRNQSRRLSERFQVSCDARIEDEWMLCPDYFHGISIHVHCGVFTRSIAWLSGLIEIFEDQIVLEYLLTGR